MSIVPLLMRRKPVPRWSVEPVAKALFPPLIAGEVGSRACVALIPPLFFRISSRGTVTVSQIRSDVTRAGSAILHQIVTLGGNCALNIRGAESIRIARDKAVIDLASR